MQQASQALSTWKPASSPSDVEPIPDSWIDEIFARLTAQLGAKIADLYAGADPGRVRSEWAEALGSFDPSEIKRGLEASRTRAFAPTLGEFLRMCRPALDPEVAWFEAQAGMKARENGEIGEWTHPGVYRAARDMAWELRSGSYREHRRRWEWLLGRELQRGFLVGVPKPALAITHQDSGGRPPTAEERRRLDDLRGSLRARIAEKTTEEQDQ